MSQLFSRSANLWFKLVLLGACGCLVAAGVGGGLLYRSAFWTRVGSPLPQPVPFSHKHHVEELEIDCRYCHTSVETSAFAGIPATEICMTCHSQIWTNAPLLEPVRASYRNNLPLHWTRIHDLPDFVYFDHGIHVRKGVGCVECHGRIDEMPITWKSENMQMRWCIECHEKSFKSSEEKPPVHSSFGLPSVFFSDATRRTEPHPNIEQLRNCSTCHR